MIKKNVLFILAVAAAFVSCRKEPLEHFNYLVEVVEERTIGKTELFTLMGMPSKSPLVRLMPDKKLRVASLKYRTKDPFGNNITASGTITFPTTINNFQSMGTILALHFTLAADKEVPSQALACKEALLALFGYVIAAPDYIGYGSTRDKVHPYHHQKNTGQVSVDLLFAAQEYMASKNNRMSRDVTIVGYSEGGYASMATLKFIQENCPGYVRVREVYSGAGAHDLYGTYQEMVASDYSSQPSTLPLMVLGLNYGDNLNLDLSKLFRASLYDNYREWFLSKNYTTKEITQKMGSTVISDFFTDDLMNEESPYVKPFINSMKKNSLVSMENGVLSANWKPLVRVYFVHGDKDTIVPFSNSKKAYEYFKSVGCDVRLQVIAGKDHIPAGTDFYLFCLVNLKLRTKTVDADGTDYTQLIDYLNNSGEYNL